MTQVKMSAQFTNFTRCNRESKQDLKISKRGDNIQRVYDVNNIPELQRMQYSRKQMKIGNYILADSEKGYYNALIAMSKKDTSLHYNSGIELIRVEKGQGELFIGPALEDMQDEYVSADQVVRTSVVQGDVISMPKEMTHGFHVPNEIIMKKVTDKKILTEIPVPVNGIDKDATNVHKYLLESQKQSVYIMSNPK
ncbi:MAG: hypothetical protein GOV02_02795 [Candidatus Aenigmarchaeota archaeon]|nr:hypothetical protein [Candidatus Aenigmarchaeota archaeon]